MLGVFAQYIFAIFIHEMLVAFDYLLQCLVWPASGRPGAGFFVLEHTMASPDDPLTLPREIRESMASINAHLGAWRIGIRDVEPLGDAQGSVDIECASELVAMEATIELPDEPLSDNDARELAWILVGHTAEAERAQATVH